MWYRSSPTAATYWSYDLGGSEVIRCVSSSIFVAAGVPAVKGHPSMTQGCADFGNDNAWHFARVLVLGFNVCNVLLARSSLNCIYSLPFLDSLRLRRSCVMPWTTQFKSWNKYTCKYLNVNSEPSGISSTRLPGMEPGPSGKINV